MEQTQKPGVDGKADQFPSGLGSRAKPVASVTGHVGREAVGSSPLRQDLAGWGAGGVRALGSPHGQRRGGL